MVFPAPGRPASVTRTTEQFVAGTELSKERGGEQDWEEEALILASFETETPKETETKTIFFWPAGFSRMPL